MKEAMIDVLPSYLMYLALFTLIAIIFGLSAAAKEKYSAVPVNLTQLTPARLWFVIAAFVLAYAIAVAFLHFAYGSLQHKAQIHFNNYSVINTLIKESGYGGPHLAKLTRQQQVQDRKSKLHTAFTTFSADNTYTDDSDKTGEKLRQLRKQVVQTFIEKPTEAAISTDMFIFAPLLSPKIIEGCKTPVEEFQKMLAALIDKNAENCTEYAVVGQYLENVLLPKPDGSYYDVTPTQIFRGLRTYVSWGVNQQGNNAIQDPESFFRQDKERGPMLEEALISYVRKMQEGIYPYQRMLQMIKGPIQLVTFMLYFFGMMLVSVRLAYLYPFGLFPNLAKHISELGDQQLSEAKTYLNQVVNGSVDYVLWALPSVGFIGTVVGISLALGDADSVVTAKGAAEQSEAINQVTSLLSVAFDTTLIALVCSLPVFACSYWASIKEAKLLLNRGR